MAGSSAPEGRVDYFIFLSCSTQLSSTELRSNVLSMSCPREEGEEGEEEDEDDWISGFIFIAAENGDRCCLSLMLSLDIASNRF